MNAPRQMSLDSAVPMLNDYCEAAQNYRPAQTRVLFIAESPPSASDRYFYFEQLRPGDWLWIALMNALFEKDWTRAKVERRKKADWLRRFQNNGFALIDAVKEPLIGTARQRIERIKIGAEELIEEVKRLSPEQIILIKTTVHRALFEVFRNNGLNVINDRPLPFPSSGHAKRFAGEFRALLPSIDSFDPCFAPVEISGGPLSQTIARERR